MASMLLCALASTGAETILPHRNARSVAFSADGKLVAAALGSRILIWEVATGALRRQIDAGASFPLEPLALSPDGSKIAAGFAAPANPTLTGGILFVWDTRTGERLADFGRSYNIELPATGTTEVLNLAYSPDGKYLGICLGGLGVRHKLVVQDSTSGKGVYGFLAGPGMVFPIAFSFGGRMAAEWLRILGVVPGRLTVTVWDLGSGRELRHFAGCGATLKNGLAFSPDGELLAAGGTRGRICVYDAEEGGRPTVLTQDERGDIPAVAFSPGGQTLASESRRKGHVTLHVWSVGSGRELRSCTIAAHPLLFGTFSPDARSFAAGDTDDNNVHLWDVDTCREIRKFGT
jgi:WD40 repeat protein